MHFIKSLKNLKMVSSRNVARERAGKDITPVVKPFYVLSLLKENAMIYI